MQNAAVDDSCGTTFGTGLLMALELYNNMFVCGIDERRVGQRSAAFSMLHEIPVIHPRTKHTLPSGSLGLPKQ